MTSPAMKGMFKKREEGEEPDFHETPLTLSIQGGDDLDPNPTIRTVVLKAKRRRKKKTPREDSVNHPAHYTNGKVECIEAIESALTPEEYRGFIKGTVMAYNWRESAKGGDQDLEKALWYQARYAKYLKKLAKKN